MSAFGLPGSCVVCLGGTDTGLAFRGDVDWIAAGLLCLGVSEGQLQATIDAANIPFGPDGVATMGVQVCRACASANAPMFPAPRLVRGGNGLPVIEAVER